MAYLCTVFFQIKQNPQPSAPPIPSEEDTLQFFDAVIASCDSERTIKPHVDDGHADVDFIGTLRKYLAFDILYCTSENASRLNCITTKTYESICKLEHFRSTFKTVNSFLSTEFTLFS